VDGNEEEMEEMEEMKTKKRRKEQLAARYKKEERQEKENKKEEVAPLLELAGGVLELVTEGRFELNFYGALAWASSLVHHLSEPFPGPRPEGPVVTPFGPKYFGGDCREVFRAAWVVHQVGVSNTRQESPEDENL